VDEKRVNDILKQRSGAKVFIRSACNITFFIFFLALYTVLALGDPLDVYRSYELYVRRRFDTGAPMPLDEVKTIEQFWEYTQTSFVNGLFGTDLAQYSYPTYEVQRFLPLDDATRLLSAVRLRTVRAVDNIDCEISDTFSNYFGACIGPYSTESASKEEYGPANPEGGQLFRYIEDPEGDVYRGKLAEYQPGGYIEGLTANYSRSMEKLAELWEFGWVDARTRAVWFEFTLYNFNTGLYAFCQIVFEVTPSGAWVKTFDVTPFQQRDISPLGFSTNREWFLLMCEGVLLFCVIRYVCEELSELVECHKTEKQSIPRIRIKMDYWLDGWNIVDWANLLLIIVTMGFRCSTWLKAGDVEVYTGPPAELSPVQDYPDYFAISSNVRTVREIYALNSVLLFLKAVKYISIVPYVSTFMGTVKFAWQSLVSFTCIFVFLLIGFILAFNVAFGLSNQNFRTFWRSFVFFVRSFLGNANFAVVYDEAPALGSVLILVFVVAMIFFTMNLFYSILISALSDAKLTQDAKNRKQLKKNMEQFHAFWQWVSMSLDLQNRFNSVFRGLASRLAKRKAKEQELQDQRNEEWNMKKKVRTPMQDLEANLGAASPDMGRRPAHGLAALGDDEGDSEDGERSEPDLGPLKSQEQLNRLNRGNQYESSEDGDVAGDAAGMLMLEDEGVSPNQEYGQEAMELVFEATAHVVNGIVERTRGAQNLVVSDMNESREVLTGITKVLEILSQRARDLEAQQAQLLRHF